MKIAYLILAHGHYEQLRRLICALDDDDASFFIHIDAKSPAPGFVPCPEKTVILSKEKVWWGGFGMVSATLQLINTAFSGGFDYYILLSGQDYPIRPNRFLKDILSRGKEHIEVLTSVSRSRARKVSAYYFTRCNRKNKKSPFTLAVLTVEKLLRLAGLRKDLSALPPIHHGSSWWALSHDCISYMLDYLRDNPHYFSVFRNALCPDESFFQTMVVDSPFRNRIAPSITFADWEGQCTSPALITASHLPALRSERNSFFARKFDDNSSDVIDLIERELRTLNH